MRERAEAADPQLQQRRRPLPPGSRIYYATCHPGLEPVVARELSGSAIGADDVQPGRAGVSFTGDAGVGFRANLWLRSAIRVLVLEGELLLDARRPAGEEVYDAFRELADWPALLAPSQSFSVDARVWSCSNLTSSQLLGTRAKDAVCDAIRDRRGAKPLPPEPGRVADLPLFVTAYHDRLTLYRDMSGASLHRRGYRQAMHRASLNEAAAAGLLYMAGWDKLCREEGAVLADPMCGSGTFLIEASLVATDTAPGGFRRWWPFTQWHDFDKAGWQAALEAARAARHPPPPGVEVWGNDVHSGALGLALRDVQAAGVHPMVRLHHGECGSWRLPRPPPLVVSNPPWGQRLGAYSGDDAGGEEDVDAWWADSEQQRYSAPQRRNDEQAAAALADTWYSLSSFLKKECAGATAFLLSGNPKASQGLRMKADRKYPVTVGGVDCRVLQYSIRGMPAPAGGAAADGGGGSDEAEGGGAASSDSS